MFRIISRNLKPLLNKSKQYQKFSDIKYEKYAKKVLNKLKINEIRALIDDRNETVGKKILEAEKKKTHIMGIIGDKEVENSEVTIRLRGGNIVGGIKLDKLSDYISSVVNKSRETNLN